MREVRRLSLADFAYRVEVDAILGAVVDEPQHLVDRQGEVATSRGQQGTEAEFLPIAEQSRRLGILADEVVEINPVVAPGRVAPDDLADIGAAPEDRLDPLAAHLVGALPV